MSDAEVTPVDRPVRNEKNAPIVSALFYLASELRRGSDALKDIARAAQNAIEEIDDMTATRVGNVLDEIGDAVKDGARDMRRPR